MPIEVLLVEDNEADARLLREILRDTNSDVRLHVVSDGDEALAFLRYQGRYLDAPRPDIVLLDLNMPKMGGFEVLINVKQDARLRAIPFIVLTSSKAQEDVVMSYQLLANCFLSKPDELEEFQRLVKSLNEFWLTRVRLPQVAQIGSVP